MKAHVARLYVGLNRQATPRNRRCKRAPQFVYEVQWFPGQESYNTFRRNMNTLARRIATQFCQDSVLVVHRRPRSKTALFVSPRKTRRAREVR